MKQFTLADLRALKPLKPCYDPDRYLPENWTGNVLDILNVTAAPFPDRLWILLRTDFFPEKFLRLYGVWCARQVQHLMQDERSIRALDVAEAFANGNANRAELAAARNAARNSARNSAGDAAWDAAMAAAWTAALDARDAARAAARNAARDARDAAMAAQEIKLREMIISGI